ncbi:DUF1700 domain-containing protein [Halobacillus sp. ACCC02827]|uniref:HAAS signaling domain-containing protein n=1 Tax=Bacillaceae TaxID=186817 RepID=UPI0002A4EAD8|nr:MULTISPECIES: DUF1700 domain-containing protein [Bacillaceae]ELK46544.1 hypothetical protein D479_10436 [Halobacillus sp. BAB-2008]QHT46104.1 DUF1700 domain-containing protein [Bacillus sp. SB49]WJE16918.1 DUF1700 domain-containing protein [Halobacillus sp. ACCC02827]
MKKAVFMDRLARELRGLPEEERKEILFDYEEHIRVGMKEGREEEEVIRELGHPKQVAKEYIASTLIEKAEKHRTFPNIFRAILASLSLSLFNLVIVLGPALGILGIYVGLVATAAALALTPFAFLFMLITRTYSNIFADFFMAMTMGSGGIMLMIGLWHLGKWLYKGSLTYLKYNRHLIKGE